ncbi:small acid-soluble spore protein Tlp [Paraclostridium bifermentans]|uniref:small acid-soluble spore protein Tlp n=1 Tax=Paraclostridium bifermentans TaxID=1490 RepID=UPI00359C6A64
MKPNPDNRKDNVEKIQFNIDSTIKNIRLADKMISKTDDPKTRKALEEKNERREDALSYMRSEIKDEAQSRENNYK